ncbi:MAG: hypothetical protein KDF63_15310, partial [Rhodoferax sp.]|nr:hypothetical protein [Rhodoferax sp.]
ADEVEVGTATQSGDAESPLDLSRRRHDADNRCLMKPVRWTMHALGNLAERGSGVVGLVERVEVREDKGPRIVPLAGSGDDAAY